MKVYQVTLKGFNPSTDETDDLIKWVATSLTDNVVNEVTHASTKYWGHEVEEVQETELSIDDAGIDMILTKSTMFVFYSIKG